MDPLSATPLYISCRTFLLLPHCAQQLYCIEILHLLGHRVIAVVFETVIKEIHSIIMFRKTVLFTGKGNKVKAVMLN
jgi:hypothetical protein